MKHLRSTFQADVLKELQKSRFEIENVRRQMLQMEISHNIQQTEALTRSVVVLACFARARKVHMPESKWSCSLVAALTV
jgi:hypothetical protein